MKKVLAITAVLALLTSVASAELLKNFKYDGSLEVLSITADNAITFDKDKAPNDKYSETVSRVCIGATFDLNDNASAKVTVAKAGRKYDSGLFQTAAGGTIDSFVFFESYLALDDVLGMNHKIGKQFYGNPGDIVIYYGPSGWFVRGLGASSIEGWTGVWKKDKLAIGAMAGKVVEGNTNAMTDTDLYGFTVSYDLFDYLNPAMYYYQSDDRSTAALQDKLIVMGLKAAGKYMDLSYSAEYAMNGGSDHNLTATTDMNYKGTAMKIDADYVLDVNKIGKFVFMGQYAMGSGDKTAGNKDDKTFYAINPNFKPGIILGGIGTGAITTISSLGNLTVTTLGANFTPNKWDKKLNLDAKMYTLKYTEATNDGIGSEIDFVATWNHSDNVSLKAAYAMFSPDKDIAIASKKDTVTLMNFYVNVKF